MATPSDAHGLLLVLYAETIPGGAQQAIGDARDGAWVGQMQGECLPAVLLLWPPPPLMDFPTLNSSSFILTQEQRMRRGEQRPRRPVPPFPGTRLSLEPAVMPVWGRGCYGLPWQYTAGVTSGSSWGYWVLEPGPLPAEPVPSRSGFRFPVSKHHQSLGDTSWGNPVALRIEPGSPHAKYVPQHISPTKIRVFQTGRCLLQDGRVREAKGHATRLGWKLLPSPGQLPVW